MTTRILLLTFYYPPDLSAGSFRAEALVKALRAELGEHVEIHVITTQPNRYHNFHTKVSSSENTVSLSISRIALPAHRSGLLDQTRAFAYFAFKTLRLTKNRNYDLVFATSSRLLTASLGAVVARRIGCGLYLDIRDILVDTLPNVLPSRVGKLAAMVLSAVERWTIDQADRINLISPGFIPYFSARYPDRSFSTHTNGVDELFMAHSDVLAKPSVPKAKERLRVLYAGNIGTGQGLHLILPDLAQRLEGKVVFHVIGAGGALRKLQAEIKRTNIKNVHIFPPMKRVRLIEAYEQADILFLHLNDMKAFRRVLPSKLFEYAATYKPIWAGISGFAGRFAAKRISNIALFRPCDLEGALTAFEGLQLQQTPRTEFVEQFSRTTIKKQMAREILQMSPKYLKHMQLKED
jgi:glycosyltransferase involved in cell wall biosynthesis